MKKTYAFLSYRNIIRDGEYVNFEILRKFVAAVKRQNPEYVFLTIEPEAIPRGTLFSSYDVAEFLNNTMNLIDKCTKFYILDNDYFNSEDNFSSIWTEAEAFVWSRYDRDMFLSAHKNKEKCFNIIHHENDEFHISTKKLLKLSEYQTRLLQVASLDFDKTRYPGIPDYSWPYLKNSKIYFIVCDDCKSVYVTEKIENKKHINFQKTFFCLKCNNKLDLEFKDGYLICNQENHSGKINNLSIFDALELLFGNQNKYMVIKL